VRRRIHTICRFKALLFLFFINYHCVFRKESNHIFDWRSARYMGENKKKKKEIDKILEEKEDDLEPFDVALELYYRSIKGEKTASRAHTLFKSLLEEDPSNTEVMAYLGAVKMMLARDEVDLREKGKYANEGLKMMDLAVLKDPSNPLLRMLRANVAINLPENRFRRTQTAIEDFEYMISVHSENPSAIPSSLLIDVMKGLVKAYERVNKLDMARTYAEKVKEKDPDYQLPALKNSDQNKGKTVDITSLPSTNPTLVEYYKQAVHGDEVALYHALNELNAIQKLKHENPIIQAYRAHCLAMKVANQATGYVELFMTAIKTSQTLDQLVSEYPELYEIRMIRALQSYRLPEFFFFRTSTAARDFQYLATQYEKDYRIFSVSQYEEILLLLGKSLVTLNMVEEAVESWKKLLQLSTESSTKKEAKELVDAFTSEDFHVSTTSDVKELYEKGKIIHRFGVLGNKKAAMQSAEIWELATKANPTCAIAKFYHAASLTLLGKFYEDPNDLFSQTIKGLKKLASALPKNNIELIDLYIKRAYIEFRLPDSFFHNNDKIIEDFEMICALYREHEGEIKLSKHKYLKILADLGTVYERKHFIHKAKEVWEILKKEDEEMIYQIFLQMKGVK